MDRKSICKENTGAVIITYNPDERFGDRLNRLIPQVNAILIVDNASRERTSILTSPAINSIEYIWNSENIGVATALNQGLEWAKSKKLEWLLTLDQDTVISEDLISEMSRVQREIPDSVSPGIIGANYTDKLLKQPFMPEESFGTSNWACVTTVITSGSIISLSAAETIGPFRDQFFIDHVDDEYSLRARKYGFTVIITRKPLMEHTVGHPKLHKFLWKQLTTPNLPAARRYYMSRNHIILIREYYRTENAWVKWSIRIRLKEIALILLLEDDKLPKLLSVIRGIIDGVLGKLGPCK